MSSGLIPLARATNAFAIACTAAVEIKLGSIADVIERMALISVFLKSALLSASGAKALTWLRMNSSINPTAFPPGSVSGFCTERTRLLGASPSKAA